MKRFANKTGILFTFLMVASALLLLAGTAMGTTTAHAKVTRSTVLANVAQAGLVDSSRSASSLGEVPGWHVVIGHAQCSQGIGETGPWACEIAVYCYYNNGKPGGNVLHSRTPLTFLEDASDTQAQAEASAREEAKSRADMILRHCIPTQKRAPHLP